MVAGLLTLMLVKDNPEPYHFHCDNFGKENETNSPVSWLVFALAVFGAGFLRERRRLTKSAPRNKWDGRNRKGRRDSPPLSVEAQGYSTQIFSVKNESLACVEGATSFIRGVDSISTTHSTKISGFRHCLAETRIR